MNPQHRGESIHVLLATTSNMRGGAEEYGLTMARAASEAGFRVSTALADGPATASLRRDYEEIGAAYYPLNIAGADEHWAARGCKRSLIRAVFRAIQVLRRARPDVVLIYLQSARRGLPLILAAALLNLPAAIVFQLVSPGTRFSPREQRIYRWARERRQQWIAISRNNQQLIAECLAVPAEELRVIYNGARPGIAVIGGDRRALRDEVRRELGLADGHIAVLTVARLHPQKGHRDIIPILPYITKDFSNLRLIWAGDGELHEQLARDLEDYGVREFVTLLGRRDDVGRLLVASDLFLLPTHFEGGQSIALAEAMELGVPVVASRASGIPEVVDHMVHGLLFRTGDQCELMSTMRWALEHPEAMSAMAVAARERVREFSCEQMTGQTLQVLRELAVRV